MINKHLYETIINDIAKIVKQKLNSNLLNESIRDYDKYNFVIQILTPLCEKYFKYSGIYGRIKTSLTKARSGQDLHRGSFNVQLKSMDNPKDPGDRFKVLCKIYNESKLDDTVTIDFEAILQGYYKYFATIINDTVYYLDLYEVQNYYQQMGNNCVSKDGRFIYVSADYFIYHSDYSAPLKSEDRTIYRNGYNKYIKKG